MKTLLSKIQIRINENVYLKDPASTDLGRRIIESSILLLDEIGLEHFTFKKLAIAIQSTEASIYRYFENKHKLLLYLVIWYWNWLEYQLVFRTGNIEDAEKRLRIAIEVLTKPIELDPEYAKLNAEALHRIVVSESSKAYLTKEVDAEVKEGCFSGYKRLIMRVVDIIQDINPDYKNPKALATLITESAHLQIHFAMHLPTLTEIEENKLDVLVDFLTHTACSALKQK